MTEPVELFMEREHAYKRRGPNPETGRKQVGCEVCRGARNATQHLGAPPSMNDGGSGLDRMAFQSLKRAWQGAFGDLLASSPLERGQEAIAVEALVGFSTRVSRDGGNYRWMIEKALGDALVDGGYLEDDCFFPVVRYDFGGIQGRHSPGRSWLRLVLFPGPAREAETATDGDLILPADDPPGQAALDLGG